MTTGRFELIRLLEAVLFASSEPLGEKDLARYLPEGANFVELMDELAALYANRGVNLIKVGDRWAFRSAADLASLLTFESTKVRKLSRVAVETLAIVAYHQPVTRAEIEEVRGVGLSRGTLDILLEAGWIKPRGRRRTPGRPVTWGTSEAFLDHFGLASLDALPGIDELKAAGLLDTRPAVISLGERGLLPGPSEAAEDVETEDEEELLPEDFGEDLVPEGTLESSEATAAEFAEATVAEFGEADESGVDPDTANVALGKDAV